MEQQINDARSLAVEQPGIKLFQLRSDTGQAGQRRKQGIEDRGPHPGSLVDSLKAQHPPAVITGLVPVISIRGAVRPLARWPGIGMRSAPSFGRLGPAMTNEGTPSI